MFNIWVDFNKIDKSIYWSGKQICILLKEGFYK